MIGTISAYAEDDTRRTVFYEHGFAVFKDHFCFELLLESLGVDTFLTAGSVTAVYGDAERMELLTPWVLRYQEFLLETIDLYSSCPTSNCSTRNWHVAALKEWNEHDLMTVTLDRPRSLPPTSATTSSTIISPFASGLTSQLASLFLICQ
jgi:hypothetical protein